MPQLIEEVLHNKEKHLQDKQMEQAGPEEQREIKKIVVVGPQLRQYSNNFVRGTEMLIRHTRQ